MIFKSKIFIFNIIKSNQKQQNYPHKPPVRMFLLKSIQTYPKIVQYQNLKITPLRKRNILKLPIIQSQSFRFEY